MCNTVRDLENYIEKCGGIHPPHLAFYLEAIRFNTCSAKVSIESLFDSIDMINKTKDDDKETREIQGKILDHCQNILTYAGALSRYFWPSKPGKHDLHMRRAATLKKHFGLTDESPLKNRNLRNQLEHFDENLDKYLWDKPIVGYVLPAYVGGQIESDGVSVHLFRAFYLDTGVFEILGVRHVIRPIIDEVLYLYKRLYSASST